MARLLSFIAVIGLMVAPAWMGSASPAAALDDEGVSVGDAVPTDDDPDDGDDGDAGDPGDGGDNGEAGEDPAAGAEPVNVQREGWYTSPPARSLPPTLTEEVPPGVVCIVIPELCPEEVQQLTQPIEAALAEARDGPVAPAQPVPPDSLPVGLLSGHERYASALEFPLPELGEDAFVEQFDLILTEEFEAMSMDSPAFRGLMDAFIAQVDQEPSPEPFAEWLAAVGGGEQEPARDDVAAALACPIIEPWEGEENQHANEQPAVDPVLCGVGERHEPTQRWTFDLSFAAQAWADGLIEYHGVLIAPADPELLAYGDPDATASFQIAYAGGEAEEDQRPMLRVSVTDMPADDLDAAEGTDPFAMDEPAESDPFTAGDQPATAGPGPAAGPADGGEPGAEMVAAPGMESPEPGDAEEPAVAEEVPEEQPAVAAAEPMEEAGVPMVPGWTFLLVPLGLGAAFAFAQALGAAPATAQVGGVLERLSGGTGQP